MKLQKSLIKRLNTWGTINTIAPVDDKDANSQKIATLSLGRQNNIPRAAANPLKIKLTLSPVINDITKDNIPKMPTKIPSLEELEVTKAASTTNIGSVALAR